MLKKNKDLLQVTLSLLSSIELFAAIFKVFEINNITGLTASLHHYIIISLQAHRYIITSLHHCVAISLYHYINTSLCHYIITSLHRYMADNFCRYDV